MDTAAVVANTQLVLREREARDRGWWELARECFHPEAAVNVAWFEGSADAFVAGSERMAGKGSDASHRLAPPVVHLSGDRAVVVLGAAIDAHAVTVDQDGVRMDVRLEADIRIVYRTERRRQKWRIVSLDCVYERDRFSSPEFRRSLKDTELAGLRPSYALLAWSFARQGIAIRDDALGDDRPDEVEALYRNAFAWAGMPYPPADH